MASGIEINLFKRSYIQLFIPFIIYIYIYKETLKAKQLSSFIDLGSMRVCFFGGSKIPHRFILRLYICELNRIKMLNNNKKKVFIFLSNSFEYLQ